MFTIGLLCLFFKNSRGVGRFDSSILLGNFSRRGKRLRLCLCRRMKPKDEASQSQLKG